MATNPTPASRPHLPWPLWIVALLFLAAASVPLVQRCHHESQRRMVPHNLSELAERIQAKHPKWQIVKATGLADGLESGFWVCDGERSRAKLSQLRRTAEYGPAWGGIVLCLREETGRLNLGEYGWRAGDFSLFGDPRMLEQIAPLVSSVLVRARG